MSRRAASLVHASGAKIATLTVIATHSAAATPVRQPSACWTITHSAGPAIAAAMASQ